MEYSFASDIKLCVSKAENSPKRAVTIQPGDKMPPFDYSIQVGEGPNIKTNQNKGFIYPIESKENRYLVKVYNANKLKSSFWLSFEEYETSELCLWFNSLYETWSVWALEKSKHLCDCK